MGAMRFQSDAMGNRVSGDLPTLTFLIEKIY